MKELSINMRIKQFYYYVNCKLTNEDKNFIDSYLNIEERNLFYKLSQQEQVHCVRVAKDVKNTYKQSNIILMKAALLHDIGKIERKLNVMDKSLLVLLDKLSKGKMNRFCNVKAIDIYYNHGKRGCNILSKNHEDGRLLYLVENHHNEEIEDDIELSILKMCDNRN